MLYNVMLYYSHCMKLHLF